MLKIIMLTKVDEGKRGSVALNRKKNPFRESKNYNRRSDDAGRGIVEQKKELRKDMKVFV